MAHRHNANKASIPIAQERRQKCLDLRKLGYTYRQIGESLKIPPSTAASDVRKELQLLAKQAQQSADELRQMEVERLDMAMNAIATQVRQGNLGAIDRWIRISERRARLFGLDAAPRLSYLDMFNKLAEDGMITETQFDIMRSAIAQFQAAAISCWKGEVNAELN